MNFITWEPREAGFIADCMWGAEWSRDDEAKPFLTARITEALEDELDHKWDIDGQRLLRRVEGMSEQEAQSTRPAIYKFWQTPEHQGEILWWALKEFRVTATLANENDRQTLPRRGTGKRYEKRQDRYPL